MKYHSDRIGRSHSTTDMLSGVARQPIAQMFTRENFCEQNIAQRIANGAIIARFDGRAEFGARALGGRSILGSPLIIATKDRLNSAKGRQSWRPVAPCVLDADFNCFFLGPCPSPYMAFSHHIRPEHISALPALSHPDGTTRVQTLTEADDPRLARLLRSFGRVTSFPILVNTSMNGRGQPIFDLPLDAVRFWLLQDDIDYLLIEDTFLCRDAGWKENIRRCQVAISPGTLLTQVKDKNNMRYIVTRSHFSYEASSAIWNVVQKIAESSYSVADILDTCTSEIDVHSIYQLIASGILT
jgi:carbamoyltransferase